MKLKVLKFQEGGAAPEAGAEMAPEQTAQAPELGAAQEPALGGEKDPVQMIIEGAQSAVEANDGNMALEVCKAFLDLVSQAQGGQGGGAPQPGGEEPTFQRRGGRLIRKS